MWLLSVTSKRSENFDLHTLKKRAFKTNRSQRNWMISVSPNVPNSGKSSEGSVRDSSSHIKTNLTRSESDAKPSLGHGKLVSKTDDLGQKQLKAHHSLKRKLDDGVKVFFNGKEIKIPKLGPVEVEKDKIDKKHLSHCKEKSSSSNVCSVEPNNSPDSNDAIPKGASSSKKRA